MAVNDDWSVTEAMLQMGGSFVQGLAALYRKADHTNQVKLKAAFPDYWNKYTELAAARPERRKRQRFAHEIDGCGPDCVDCADERSMRRPT